MDLAGKPLNRRTLRRDLEPWKLNEGERSTERILCDATLRLLGTEPMVLEELRSFIVFDGRHPYVEDLACTLEYLVGCGVVERKGFDGEEYALIDRRYGLSFRGLSEDRQWLLTRPDRVRVALFDDPDFELPRRPDREYY